jgi:PIN domain nuclease of toxin-antitoxin system
MRLLLDTHAFLWFIAGDSRLSQSAKAAISDVQNEAMVSAGSLWELAIKHSQGKLALTQPFLQLVPAQLAQNDIEVLPISLDHLDALITLPFHHRDPFDRLMIAQALVEKATLVSCDRVVDQYPVSTLW